MFLTIAERVNSYVAMFFQYFDEYQICELVRSSSTAQLEFWIIECLLRTSVDQLLQRQDFIRYWRVGIHNAIIV